MPLPRHLGRGVLFSALVATLGSTVGCINEADPDTSVQRDTPSLESTAYLLPVLDQFPSELSLSDLAIQDYGGNPDTLFKLAQSFEDSGNLLDAVELYTHLGDMGNEGMNRAATAHFTTTFSLRDGEELLRQANIPLTDKLYSERGEVQFQDGSYSNSLDAFRKGNDVEGIEKATPALLDQASDLEQQGKYKLAYDLYGFAGDDKAQIKCVEDQFLKQSILGYNLFEIKEKFAEHGRTLSSDDWDKRAKYFEDKILKLSLEAYQEADNQAMVIEMNRRILAGKRHELRIRLLTSQPNL